MAELPIRIHVPPYFCLNPTVDASASPHAIDHNRSGPYFAEVKSEKLWQQLYTLGSYIIIIAVTAIGLVSSLQDV